MDVDLWTVQRCYITQIQALYGPKPCLMHLDQRAPLTNGSWVFFTSHKHQGCPDVGGRNHDENTVLTLQPAHQPPEQTPATSNLPGVRPPSRCVFQRLRSTEAQPAAFERPRGGRVWRRWVTSMKNHVLGGDGAICFA